MEDNDHARLVPDTTGSDFTLNDYAIPPEHQARAQELMDQFNANPIAAPSPVRLTGSGSFKEPERFTAGMLPPDKRTAVEQELAKVPLSIRADREHELVAEALQANSMALRIKAGLGEGSTEFEREQYAVAREIHELEQREIELRLQLAEVEKFVPVYDEISGKPVFDPQTGQQKLTPVEAVRGERRRGFENAIAELVHRIELLRGIEGDRRIQKALRNTVLAEARQKQQLADRAEIERRAEELAREKRLNQQAELLARFKGAEL